MAMFRSALVLPTSSNLLASIAFPKPIASRSKPRAGLQQLKSSSGDHRNTKSAVIADSLRALEWDKVCDLVSSFAGTQLAREIAKAQLWSTSGLSFEESMMRLRETSAAIELINYGVGGMDFAGIDVVLVKSAICQASKHLPITGLEAMAIVSLIEFAENLQSTVENAVEEDADYYSRFMPLAEVILNASICHSLAKTVHQIIDEDGSVKDSASSELKLFRDQVRMLERKVYQLMDKLARNSRSDSSSLEVCNVDGRWCIKSMPTRPVNFDGLLLSSCTGSGNLIEPIVAIPLNDELQQAKALVVKAEDDVLSQLSDKMLAELGCIQDLLDFMIQLDAVAARAKYCIEYGATYPNIFLPCDSIGSFTVEGDSQLNGTLNKASFTHPQREWKLYMPKACHPLLLKQYHENLKDSQHALTNAASDLRRKKMQGKSMPTDDIDSHLDQMKQNVLQMERCPLVPGDFIISTKTTVVVVTGPNTGGKTISLKTVGLASLMSKAGLYVLASEPVKVPWFDAVYADIGDEQSLTQSLSTFSGHLKNISSIRSNSTNKSLVLLDEVGAGTNPLEGAALGMSLLESLAESGCFLTIATTHHGELKTLKYSNHLFENACVEFDEESLKPTYRVLWGIPGRSNAINIAEKLGLPHAILSKAQKLHGKSSAEINEIIVGMESSKQDFEQHLQGAQHHLELSRKLHHDLMMAKERVAKHSGMQITRKAKAISDIATMARSAFRAKLHKHRESLAITSTSQYIAADSNEHQDQNLEVIESTNCSGQQDSRSGIIIKPAHEKPLKIPQVGQKVLVPSLGKEAVVLEVLASKGQILVQANNIKLRLRLTDLSAEVRNN